MYNVLDEYFINERTCLIKKTEKPVAILSTKSNQRYVLFFYNITKNSCILKTYIYVSWEKKNTIQGERTTWNIVLQCTMAYMFKGQ